MILLWLNQINSRTATGLFIIQADNPWYKYTTLISVDLVYEIFFR